MSDQTQMEALLLRSFGEALDAEASNALAAWLSENPVHRERAEQLRQIWDASSLEKPFTLDYQADLNTVRQKAGLDQMQVVKKASPWYRRYGLAAAAVALLVVGWWVRYGTETPEMLMVQNQDREKMELVLPDGTHIWLKKGANLQYPAHFSAGKRTVRLKGVAFFQVTHNPAQVFEVISPQNDRITVLGTEFEARFSDDSVNVQVRSGKVRFEGPKAGDVLLTSGQKAVFERSSNHISVLNATENDLFWQSGLLRFQNTPLQIVLETMEQCYQIEINLHKSDLKNCAISAVFP
ncbi:MAG: FecR domain-containing protein, partial [Bacteroidetes bacterium]|nr:FecR domain-containing protein [Bacteroidota bacterium]